MTANASGGEGREALLALFASWSDHEIAEFMAEARRGREGELRLCVVEGTGPEREILLVAPHDPDRYPDGWSTDAPLCQYGQCSECEAELISWAKHVRCPLCNGEGYCT